MNPDSTSDNTASRRTILIAGSAVALGSVLLRGESVLGNGGLASLAATPGPRISVGYVEGSAGAASLDGVLADGSTRVVPARSLRPAGLSNQAARLVVHGFTPGTTTDATSRYGAVFVDAHIASPDRFSDDATIPFYAWTFRRGPSPMASGQSHFVIGPSRGLRLGFSVASDGGSASTIVFTSGSERQLPKLQRGVYLLGLEPDAWQTTRSLPAADDPAWANLGSMVVSVDTV